MTEDSSESKPRRQNRPAAEAPSRPRQNRKAEEAPERPKRQNRQFVVELEESGDHKLVYALGALGGLAIGALLLRGLGGVRAETDVDADVDEGVDTSAREQAARAVGRFRPARLSRPPRDQEALVGLEDAVLDAYLGDDTLRDCGIDVGAISRGIVELSGSVWTRDQAHRAVSVARSVPGVETVVNRMEIEEVRERLHPRDDSDEGMEMSGEWTGHQSGMGSRRQGEDTEPNRPDDSHVMREDSLEQADRSQFADEGYYNQPRVGDAHDGPAPNPTNFREDELDNQSPFGKHAVAQGNPTDGPPQALNSQSRVGEGMKPGTELALEAADVPVKPHQHPTTERPS